MKRKVWRWDPEAEVIYEVSDPDAPINKRNSGPYLQKDCEAFKSPVTGGMIDGKRALREHLKETGCRIVDPSEAKLHGISN